MVFGPADPYRRSMLRARLLVPALVLPALAFGAEPAMAKPVEVLKGNVKSVGHAGKGRAAVVVNRGRRTLTLRRFKIDPGPKVLVYLVPKSARSDRQVPRKFVNLGKLKGSKGNQSYRIPRSVDLRRFSSVVFWCVPFTQTLARADLRRS